MNQLEAIRQFTKLVLDSSDIESIRSYRPEDATTNPSIILKSINTDNYKHLIDSAMNYAEKQGGSKEIKIINASDKITVDIGTEILKYIPGRVSTEIDARLSFDTIGCIKKAKKLIKLYKENGVDCSRVLIKLASTWEGICAAEILEKEGIKCNLTLIFSHTQACACAQANVFLISPFVGRIYDWYNNHNKNVFDNYSPDKDPGVMLVQNIYNYYKKYDIQTIIMGASFRRIEQITALAGCDYLTISPNLFKELQNSHEPLERKLKPLMNQNACKLNLLSDAEFRWKHNQNQMAVEKLSEGIRTFSDDQDKLEIIFKSRL
ncbi:transaldolase [Candidatus Pantoea edessiphila]|uniref:Transaldolase n=1 Tax=Candidatus Pantoea edessiphila TaxID=2044610 RepID=A0A2P5SWI2_9GAMM|nr:transaldolase [Candidatus Pantoea edessiphila]PPI86695.1 transaldolase [Candidatus Pantoea edessiphila]